MFASPHPTGRLMAGGDFLGNTFMNPLMIDVYRDLYLCIILCTAMVCITVLLKDRFGKR